MEAHAIFEAIEFIGMWVVSATLRYIQPRAAPFFELFHGLSVATFRAAIFAAVNSLSERRAYP
jgi:hypothetical protein